MYSKITSGLNKITQFLRHLISEGDIIWSHSNPEALYLRAFTIIFTPFLIILLSFRAIFTETPDEMLLVFVMGSPIVIVFVAAIFLSKTRYYAVGSLFILYTISAISFFGTVVYDSPTVIYYITISSVLATVILSLKFAVVVNVTNIVLVFLVPLFVKYQTVETANQITLVIAIFLLSVTIAWLRGKYLQQLQAQAARFIEIEKQRLKLHSEARQTELIQKIMGDIAHEFRTPLSIVNTNLYLARKTDERDKLESVLNNIQQQSTYLTQVMDTFSKLLEIQNNSDFAFVDVDLEMLFRSLHNVYSSRAKSKGIILELMLDGKLPCIRADEKLLSLAFGELFKNAIQFTDQEGMVTASLENHESIVRITITDSGMGIKPQDLPNVFDAFFKADVARTMAVDQGPGVGLMLVQEVVVLHNGKLWIESQVDKGTSVYVELPVHPVDLAETNVFPPRNIVKS